MSSWVQIVIGIIGVVWLLISLKIQSAVQEAVTLIKIHIASDEQIHKAIEKHLEAIDRHLEFNDRKVNQVIKDIK